MNGMNEKNMNENFDNNEMKKGCGRFRGCHRGPEGMKEGFGMHGFRGPAGAFGPHKGFGPGFEGRGPEFHGPRGPFGGFRFFPEPDSLTGLLFRVNRAMQVMPGSMRGSRRVLKLLKLAGGQLSQRELQHLLDIQPGSMSELLKKMEIQGLIVRERDGEDRRKVTVALTEKGTALAEQKHGRPDPYAALTDEEKETLKALLSKLVASWEPARKCRKANPCDAQADAQTDAQEGAQDSTEA
ncbi:MAG: winged helix-turn-helix transcriptional regulator [Lachnospiraceae bacterium]|nr:winged helix-turn-helix transcriptional regulator [Lachnospiraceae bacterium]